MAGSDSDQETLVSDVGGLLSVHDSKTRLVCWNRAISTFLLQIVTLKKSSKHKNVTRAIASGLEKNGDGEIK